MHKLRFISVILFNFALACAPAIAASDSGVLKISSAFAPEAPPVAPVMAGYLTLGNPGSKPITITASHSKAFRKVEIHRMKMENGMMHMERQPTLEIPAHSKVRLEPGGYHLMLIGPKKHLQAGDKIAVVLEFKSGKRQSISLPVIKPDTGAKAKHHHSMQD